MALPSSGAITMAMIAAEIGISASGLSLNDSRVRQLAGRPSGQISFSDFHGKSWLLPPTISLSSVVYDNGRGVQTSGGRYRPTAAYSWQWFRIYFSLGGGPGTVSAYTSGMDSRVVRHRNQQIGSNYIRFQLVDQQDYSNRTNNWTYYVTVTNARGSASIAVPMHSYVTYPAGD